MLDKKILKAINLQIKLELDSSQLYLSMASWAETNGYDGTSQFLYAHSDEERMHGLKLVKFVNERGGKALIPAISDPKQEFASLNEIFKMILDHETMVTQHINDIVGLTLELKDYSTHNFLQWYVAEQIEEERLSRTILDKLNLIGNDKGGMYLFDRDIIALHSAQK